MNFDYMEDMAREYNHVLKANTFDLDGFLSDAIMLIEKQLDIISAALFYTKPLNNSLTYLESLKRLTLIDLYNFKNVAEIPKVTPKNTGSARGINTLINMQIDLLVCLDTMAEKGLGVGSVRDREERACAVISLIR